MKKLLTSLAALLTLSSAAFAQVPVNPPAGGLTQAAADARYCALAGCTMVGNITLPATGSIIYGTGSKATGVSDGIVVYTNNAGTDFTRISLGGTTAAFPSIRRNGTTVNFELADNSGFTGIAVSSINSTNGLNIGVLGNITGNGVDGKFLVTKTSGIVGVLLDASTDAKLTLRNRADGADAAFAAGAVTLSGAYTSTAGSIAVDTPALTATQTWNAGGTTFKPIYLNVTNTASNANSRLIDLQVSSSSKFAVDSSGNGTFASAINSNGGTSGFVNITTSGSIASASNISQTAGTTFYTGATSGTDTYTVATPALTAYTTGACYQVRIGTTNTSTTPTININSLGAKTIVKRASTAVAAGDLVGSSHYIMCYQGTNMQVLNPTVP